MAIVKQGMIAPQFSLKDRSAVLRKLSDLQGEFTVLYFYPKDDTPGCTIEAQEFTLNLIKLQKLGASVIGVSGGDAKSKSSFCKKYDLKVTLLSDEDLSVSKKFGAYGKKTFMGREFTGILRKTFILDRAGKVIKVYPAVKAKGHAEEVLAFISGLAKLKIAAKKVTIKAATAKKPLKPRSIAKKKASPLRARR